MSKVYVYFFIGFLYSILNTTLHRILVYSIIDLFFKTPLTFLQHLLFFKHLHLCPPSPPSGGQKITLKRSWIPRSPARGRESVGRGRPRILDRGPGSTYKSRIHIQIQDPHTNPGPTASRNNICMAVARRRRRAISLYSSMHLFISIFLYFYVDCLDNLNRTIIIICCKL